LPLTSGKSTYNFKEIAEELIDLDILRQGETAKQISLIWKNQLANSSLGTLKAKGNAYLSSKKGSVKRSIEKIVTIL
jgi:3-deoxy-D-manno-octulosonic-acid transferase